MAHHEVALDMNRQLGPEVEPDEFFIATHIKKGGGWVDDRVRSTYTNYKDHLREVELQMGDTSMTYASTKLEIWRDVADGKTQGRCYGTGDLATNIRPSVTSLTQESRAHTSGSDGSESRHSTEEALHQEVIEG